MAQYYVGVCYRHGNSIKKNDKFAFQYYKKVAKNDFVAGQLQLGYFYHNGIGIEKNLKKAIDWYEKAANNGNIKAICYLGLCYKIGGVEKDSNESRSG